MRSKDHQRNLGSEATEVDLADNRRDRVALRQPNLSAGVSVAGRAQDAPLVSNVIQKTSRVLSDAHRHAEALMIAPFDGRLALAFLYDAAWANADDPDSVTGREGGDTDVICVGRNDCEAEASWGIWSMSPCRITHRAVLVCDHAGSRTARCWRRLGGRPRSIVCAEYVRC